MLSGRADAEDVAQDVWLLLARQPPGRVRSLRSWLGIAIRHVASRARQRDRRRAERERIVARCDCVPSVLEQLERESERKALEALVEGLNEPYRGVVRRRYLEERAIEEIAIESGRSPVTLRSQLKRGLDQLRVRMGLEPGRRRKLSSMLAGLLRSRSARPGSRARAMTGTTTTLVLGAGAGALIVSLLAVSRTERRQLVVQPHLGGRAHVALLDAPGARHGRSPSPAAWSAGPAPGLAAPPPPGGWDIEVEGDVLAPGGERVSGAAILVGDGVAGEPRIAAHADARGHYRIRAVDRRLLVWAEHPARAASRRHLLGSARAGAGLDLLLGHPLGGLAGRVLSDEGRPVPGAAVVLLAPVKRFWSSDQGTLALGPPPARVQTTVDGSFRLALPALESGQLLVAADGHAPLAVKVTLGGRGHEDLEIQLPASCLLEGQLLWPDGVPAGGARLGLAFPDPLPGRETTTDDEGAFRFDGLPAGPYVVRLLEDTGAGPSCYVEGELAVGQRARQTILLREEHTILGRALDGDRPLAGWSVELEERQLVVFPCDLRRVQTLDDGSFAFPSCAPAGRYLVRLHEPGDARGMPRDVVRDVRAGAQEVILRPSEATASGGSLVGAFEASSPSLRPVLATLRSDFYPDPQVILVDSSGGFSVSHLSPGFHQLRGWVPGLGVFNAQLIEIRPAQRTELFVQVPEPGSLRIRVEPPEPGREVNWDELSATVQTPSFHESESQAHVSFLRKHRQEGYLSIELFPGEYRCQLTCEGIQYESRSGWIEPGATVTETVRLREVVPMTLTVLLDRRLHKAERLSVLLRRVGEERAVGFGKVTRKGSSESCQVFLARGTTELRVESSRGLRGALVLTDADIVPGGELRVRLGEIRIR